MSNTEEAWPLGARTRLALCTRLMNAKREGEEVRAAKLFAAIDVLDEEFPEAEKFLNERFGV